METFDAPLVSATLADDATEQRCRPLSPPMLRFDPGDGGELVSARATGIDLITDSVDGVALVFLYRPGFAMHVDIPAAHLRELAAQALKAADELDGGKTRQ